MAGVSRSGRGFAFVIAALTFHSIVLVLEPGLSSKILNQSSKNKVDEPFPNKLYDNRYVLEPRMPSFVASTIEEGPVNSVHGTTGVGVPGAMTRVLETTGKIIQNDAETFYGSKEAVDALEELCGWDASLANFEKPDCLDKLPFKKEIPQLDIHRDMIDIVTPSIRNLGFLNDWREFFQGYHVIIIQDGDPNVHLEIPDWVDYELYNRNDIKEALGKNEWIISKKDASIRNFGFLVSKKPFIYTIDDDCRPALNEDGYFVNPIYHHLRNLLAPSNPHFFNTLYDPYNEDSDFVRGYPYSLRAGVPTAVSHGLWMQTPDYDAPTQLLKPEERVTTMHNMAITIPINVFYPMCSMNVAFSRELIGPAFMQGLMGEGHPWARYDDMFAGWASKVVADHLGYGVKSGAPYIRHNKASNPFTNLQKEYKGLWWQEDVIRFFRDDVQFTQDADTAQKAYVELARQIRDKFETTHVYFGHLASAMELWIEAWDDFSSGKIVPKPSRIADKSVAKKFGFLNTKGHSHFQQQQPMDSNAGLGTLNWLINFLSFWGTKRSQKVVTDNDIKLGHGFKTYILPLEEKFHQDANKQYNLFGCVMEPCSKTELSRLPFQYVDHQAEAIILRKLVSSLSFTTNIEEADLILVPALPVTISWHHQYASGDRFSGCRAKGYCVKKEFENLKELIKVSRESGKKHLFLATQDSSQNHRIIQEFDNDSNIAVATFGPSKLVVPSLNPATWLQPSLWKGAKPIAERAVFLSANFGRSDSKFPDRQITVKQLDAYSGSKNITTSFSADLLDTIFVACFPGDLPFQKRFFDTMLSGAIPVVVKREYDFGVSYWDMDTNHGLFFSAEKLPKTNPANLPTIENSLPFSKKIPYDKLVVEVTPEILREGKLMEFLEAIPMADIEARISLIEEVRNLFVYDFSGSSHDAFSIMLESVAEWVNKAV